MKLRVHIEEWPFIKPFAITGHVWKGVRPVIVELQDGNAIGRGEGAGVYYLQETAESMLAQIENAAKDICAGISREKLMKLLPPGGARNAVDCALWDLEAKKTGKTIWELTGVTPGKVTTVFTIGIEKDPETMAQYAVEAAQYPILKIKLDSHMPLEKLTAIRAARPDARIVVDANQGWSRELLLSLLPKCAELNISMIEQPLARGADAELDGVSSPITLAADESCLHTGELDGMVNRYDMINIKLDKTGGLTEALALAKAARSKGFKLMVGNMCGTSLAMAPAFVIACLCDFVDIDGPLLLRNDRLHGLCYDRGTVKAFDPVLWG